jgi:multidrug efflux system membrane fusion protein
LQSVHFKEGAIVRPGDLLFQIDPRPFQAEVDRLKCDLVPGSTLRRPQESNSACPASGIVWACVR